MSEHDFRALDALIELRGEGVPVEWEMLHDGRSYALSVLGAPLPLMDASHVHAFILGARAAQKALTR